MKGNVSFRYLKGLSKYLKQTLLMLSEVDPGIFERGRGGGGGRGPNFTPSVLNLLYN